MVGRTNEDLERRRGVSEEVLWVSKDGERRVVDSGPSFDPFQLQFKFDRGWDFTYSVLPPEFFDLVRSALRERALGVKCDEMQMGRP